MISSSSMMRTGTAALTGRLPTFSTAIELNGTPPNHVLSAGPTRALKLQVNAAVIFHT